MSTIDKEKISVCKNVTILPLKPLMRQLIHTGVQCLDNL